MEQNVLSPPKPPVPDPLQRGGTVPVLGPPIGHPPQPVKAPTVRPKAEPSKPVGFFKKFAKALTILAIGLVAYGSYLIYQRRRPYEWSGTVEARTASVGSRYGGRVKNILVHEGDDVKAGEVLVQLEAGDLYAQQAMAEAELAAAEAALQKILAGSRKEEITQARARNLGARSQVSEAAGRKEQEEKELARLQVLFKGKAISQAEYEAKVGATKAAAEALSQAVSRANEAEAALKLTVGGAREEDVKAAQAAVAAATAKVDIVKSQVAELSIRAARDSRVEALTVRPGDILAPSATAVSLLESEQLFVRVYVPETLIGKLAVSQQVAITVDSFPGRTFPGVVEHINHVGEFTPRSLQTTEERSDQVFGARVAVTTGGKDLRAGMAALITIPKK